MDSKSEAKGGESPPRMASKDGESIFADASYAQTYLVMKDKAAGKGAESKASEGTEVLFACGNWCYRGQIQFNNLKIVLSELPILIPTLQRQQSSLRYFCNAQSIPQNCPFHEPMQFMKESANFYAKEMTSVEVETELEKMSKMFPWLDDATADGSMQYFELELDSVPEYMQDVAIIANKTYVHGLIIISVYFKGTLYYLIKDGEGDQALLDVRFPDVTKKGQGMHLASYTANDAPYSKLTLWNMLGGADEISVKVKDIPKVNTLSMSSTSYQQTYCILRSAWGGASPALNIHHDALFRFGSWCYAGRVQLTPSIALADIPFVIPALRMQQSRLEYLCNVDKVPTTSPFANALDYLHSHNPVIEEIILESTNTLEALIERLTRMGLGESVSKWLDGDPTNSFFEFKLEADNVLKTAFETVEMVATKMYYASGIMMTCIFFDYTLYLCVGDASNENPLLDSKFPDVSGKGRGYQISSYENGHPEWPALRKVSIWQTVGALEQEFRDKASGLAEGKLREQAGQEITLDQSHGSSSFPQHSEGKDWRANNDPESVANVGGGQDSKVGGGGGGSTIGSEIDYEGDNEGTSSRQRSSVRPNNNNNFDVHESEAKRLAAFEAEAATRNQNDLKSIGGRIQAFNNANNNATAVAESSTPLVAESKEPEHEHPDGAAASTTDDGSVSNKAEAPSPVRGAAGSLGTALTPVRGVSSNPNDSPGSTGSPSSQQQQQPRDTLASLAGKSAEEMHVEADLQAGAVTSAIESLKAAQSGRAERDKDLLHKQEGQSTAEGTSYLDRTPTGGLKDFGNSLLDKGGTTPGGSGLSSTTHHTPLEFGKGSVGVSRPHHLPKMNPMAASGLSGKLESIKKSMGGDAAMAGGQAPWDAKGRPLQSIGGGGSNDSKK
jgi:hypothetical protein